MNKDTATGTVGTEEGPALYTVPSASITVTQYFMKLKFPRKGQRWELSSVRNTYLSRSDGQFAKIELTMVLTSIQQRTTTVGRRAKLGLVAVVAVTKWRI